VLATPASVSARIVTFVESRDPRQHHVALAPGEVGRYALLPGDPARVPLLAQELDEPRPVAQNREFTTWCGTLDGERVAVTSTGVGCPSAAIAVEELARVGVETVVRVGTAGGMQMDVRPGELVVAEAAVRDEGTSPQYLPLAYPAVADLDVTTALRDGLREAALPHHVGVVHSKDSYFGQREPGRMPVGPELEARWRAWIAGGALCSEMEAAAIFVVARVLGLRAGAVLLVAGNQELDPGGELRGDARLEDLVRGAFAGLRVLVERDRQRGGSARSGA
jgi:uridine phosphorylase